MTDEAIKEIRSHLVAQDAKIEALVNSNADLLNENVELKAFNSRQERRRI